MALGANRAGGRGGRGLVTAGRIGRDTASDGWVRVQVAGMGIASYDVTGDGYPDVFLTSQGDNRLQTLTTGPAQRPIATLASSAA